MNMELYNTYSNSLDRDRDPGQNPGGNSKVGGGVYETYGGKLVNNHMKYDSYETFKGDDPDWPFPLQSQSQSPNGLHNRRQYISQTTGAMSAALNSQNSPLGQHKILQNLPQQQQNHHRSILPDQDLLNGLPLSNNHYISTAQPLPPAYNPYNNALNSVNHSNNSPIPQIVQQNNQVQHQVVRQLKEKFRDPTNPNSTSTTFDLSQNIGGGGEFNPLYGSNDKIVPNCRTKNNYYPNGESNNHNHNNSNNSANAPQANCLQQDHQDNLSRGNSFFQSIWIHCRLPILLLLIFILLILFLFFSGALIYLKYVPYKSQSSQVAEDEPCESTFCAFNSGCFVENGRAVCRCPDVCSSSYDPVCGNDENTYPNECLLRMYACQNQKSVRIKHPGECDMPNPCSNHACLFGSRCIPSKDGIYATCECPEKCPNYGDSEESQQVCASNGRVYKNRCEMDSEACRMARNITMKYMGKCDPCEDISCSPPQVCHLNEDRRPMCRCSETCSMDFNPVCSSNGKTFQNECVMRQEACRSRMDLRIIYRGKCSSGVNPCESRVCRGYESCQINRFGIAQCTCAMICDHNVKPVCGSDGRTYDNQCQLSLISCREAKHITVAHQGTCESGNICASHTCPPSANCREKDDQAICECPVCQSDYEPVCGEDYVSYQNECRLRLESCLSNREIKILYPGLCQAEETTKPTIVNLEIKCQQMSWGCCEDGVTEALGPNQSGCPSKASDLCSNVMCKFGARCENGNCVCPQNCPLNRELVCGSNLLTYANECELQKASCVLGRSLSVHFYGDCTEGLIPGNSNRGFGTGQSSGQNFNVPNYSQIPAQYIPIDHHFGQPTTAITTKSQDDNSPPQEIKCEFGAVLELAPDGFPRCTCLLNCSSNSPNLPICASDLKLYASECDMKKEACHRQTELRPRPMELCEEIESKPCDGKEPLKNAETGEDINCGSGYFRTNCPSNSFCHHTTTFAKCCKKQTEKTTKAPLVKVKSDGKCQQSSWGCCPDGVTEALGPDQGGCPSKCNCNKLGSIEETCDPITEECRCRPGVGGKKCNFCLPGYWGLTRAIDGQQGCRPCECSKFGSIRDDCEQMSGRCVCKSNIIGRKCDQCSEGLFLGPYGCTSDPINLGQNCDQIVCNFEAECEQDGNRAGCVCNFNCDETEKEEISCGSDGYTYESECKIRLQSCRNQKAIWVLHKGQCGSDGTENPIKRWTEPGDDGYSSRDQIGPGFSSSGMKSTRHLPLQPKFHDNFQKNFYSHRSPTSATIQRRSYLGDFCQTTTDCITAHSICLSGWCTCREGYYEDPDRVQCKLIHSHLSNVEICGSGNDESLCEQPTTCFDHRNGSHNCLCPLSKSNSMNGCILREISFPFFGGRSNMRIGKLAGYHKLSIELEISPMIDYSHGIIIFSSQHANGSGDFLSIALVDGYAEFRYDLGDGPAHLRSANRLYSGNTYHVVAKRYNRDGLLRVDEDEDIKGFSPGSMKSLNLDHGGYIGYVPIPLNSTKIWETVGTSEGFVGCIHKLKVGRRVIEFEVGRDPLISSIEKVYQCPIMSTFHRLTTTSIYGNFYEQEIDEEKSFPSFGSSAIDSNSRISTAYDTFNSLTLDGDGSVGIGIGETAWDSSIDPCAKNPCQNNGLCWIDKGHTTGYKCVCHPEYQGGNCDIRSSLIVESGSMIDFRGFSYLEFPKIENAGRTVQVELWLLIRERNGLILYNGQEMGKGDFLAMTIHNGHIQFLFDLGSGIANLTWNSPIELNKWIWIVAKREGRMGKLQIDGQPPQTIRSPPMLSELNLELPLYIGSIRDMNMVHRELGILQPFDGVLQFLKINGETYHREINSALRERLVHKFEGLPCGSSVAQCLNGGTCFPRLESFVCTCPDNFSGKNCEIRKEIPGPIRFNGQNFLRFPRKVAKHESFNFSDYDDFYNEHFDSQLDELFFGGGNDDEDDENGQLVPINDDDIDTLEPTLPTFTDTLDEDQDFVDQDQENHENEDEFVPLVENEFENDESKIKAHKRNRIEIVFRSTTEDTPGVILWTGTNFKNGIDKKRRGYLGLFLVDGYPELRIDLGATGRKKKPVIIRSKVKVSDGRWHQILVARRRRLIVLQVDGFAPQRATAPVGSRVLLTDGRYFIGGVSNSILPSEIPPDYHQGFVGCVDLVRIEKRRLPLAKIAYANNIPMCEDDD